VNACTPESQPGTNSSQIAQYHPWAPEVNVKAVILFKPLEELSEAILDNRRFMQQGDHDERFTFHREMLRIYQKQGD
jgi:hypothetical protein